MSTLSQLYNNVVTLMHQTFSKKSDVDNSISSHNSNSSAHSTEMAKKVNVNQGSTNASKNVVTDSSGNITVEAKPTIPTKTSDLTNDSNYVTTTDSRLSDSRTPKSHAHGNITNDGKVGSTANKPLITTTNGAVTTGSFGTSANTFCQGNDSRLSDARTPTSHTHGNVTNDGKLGSASGKIITTGTNGLLQASDSITKSMISDFPSSMAPTSHTHYTGEVSDNSAYSNIGSSANATQKTINDKINTALGNKANSNNVYTKSETYTQSEITTAISNAVGNLSLFEIVTSLPTTNIKTNRLYLVANEQAIESNNYDIYLRVNNAWEKLDSLDFDIANFYNKTETDTLLAGKVDNTDSRLTDSRTPKSHTHGNITNTGAVGSTANKPLITTTNGAVTTGSFGTSANTFCQGNDSRLSDARTPTSHTHGSITNDGKIGTASGKIITTGTSGVLQASDSITKSMISDFPTSMTPTSHTHTKSEISDFPSTMTPSSHTHGNLQNDGTVKVSNTVQKSKNLVTDANGYLNVEDKITKTSQLTNDSGFLTSHQDISGKIDTAGTGLSKSGTTLNHSNSITAVTTAAFKKIKYDAQGHITGTADVAASDLPSHTHSQYALSTDIPSSTSGLTNDGEDGTNPFVSDDDSRLSDARTPTSHSHGSLANGGTLNSDITSVNKIAVTDSSNNLKTISQLPYSKISGTPTIPSKTSDLTNDSGFLTSHQSLANYVTTTDSRLSDARTPTSHSHGNLTNDGKVGSTANYFVYTTTGGAITSKQKIGNITTSGAIGSTSGLPLKTTTSGVITTGSFGTTSGTFCQGNDSRLHTHTFTYSNGSLTIS